MNLTVDLWQVIGFAVTLGGGFLGGLKLIADQFMRRMDERFAAISTDLDKHLVEEQRAAARMDQIERDLMSMRAELPEKYLRREDHIRSQSTIEAKLDALAGKIENAQLRGLVRDA